MDSLAFFILRHFLISFLIFMEFCNASDTITANQSMSDGETLVSFGQRFELGFFSPGKSKNRYLGIWCKNVPDAILWVANRNKPITDSYGALTISKNGTLILHNRMKNVIWFSSTATIAESPFVQLLDTGNLVITDKSSPTPDSYIWQSFDFPTDTRLPGMKMGHGLSDDRDRYLVSWKSADDPSPGDFTYRIDNYGLPQVVILAGSTKKFRSGAWNGLRLGGFPVYLSTFSPIFVFNEDKLYHVYDPYNQSVTTRLTLNPSGLLERYRLNETSPEWSFLYSIPKDQCDNFGQCGPNAICRIYRTPMCECLNGFIPKSLAEWEILDWSSGCVRRTSVGCQGAEGFVKVEGVKLPDFLDFWLNKSMNLKECKVECLKNCSCKAYANPNITGGGCLMWFGELTDIREFTDGDSRQDIYIRLAASELKSIRDSNRKKRLVITLVVSVISGMLISGVALWFTIWKNRTKRKGEDWELPLFDFATIATATNNFSTANVLGVGGFGPVYKGNLPMGHEIAVKRLAKNSGQGLEEFKNEILSIAKLQHRNLVKLVGCCIQRGERMLIYEYMPNKSLNYFIFGQNGSTLLPWKNRFDIVMGIARGLLYLHQDSRLRIIHRDLKASNVLLDRKMNPKISDFGLARIFGGDQIYARTKRVIGTYGYMSPEYAVDGKFSMRSDVFSFGVLLLEIVSGKKNRGFSHPKHHHNLLGHAWLLWHEDKALELMDTCLKDSCVESQMLRCIQVGLLCVQKLPQDRPEMSSVVLMLVNEGTALPQPKQPGFFVERSSSDTGTVSREVEFHTEDAETITMLEPR